MKTYRTGILIAIIAIAALLFSVSFKKNVAQSEPQETIIHSTKNATDAIIPTPHLPGKDSPANNELPQPLTHLQQRYQAIANNSYPDLETRQEVMHQHNPDLRISDEELVDLLHEPNAWRNLAQVPAGLPLSVEEKNDGREFIEINTKRWAVLLPGDEIELPLSRAGVSYTLVIDGIEKQAGNTITWHGHLKNSTEPMLVSLTQGEGISLGGFDTPNGHYVIQVNDNQGWVASSSTLFKPNPDHQTDMVIPPTEPHSSP